MTYEQFWRGDPWLAKYYREAYVERRKEENRRDWLQGAYIYNAVATAIGNAFRKKGAKTANYVEEPFQIFPLSEAEARAKMETEKHSFSVQKIDDVYVVDAEWLAPILMTVNMEDYESLQYFQRVLRSSGIIDELERQGIQEDDLVSIFDFEFNYIR